MNKTGFILLVALIVAGDVITFALIFKVRSARKEHAGEAPAPPTRRIEEEIAALGPKLEGLSKRLQSAPIGEASPAQSSGVDPNSGILERLAAIEERLAEMQGADSTFAAAKLREEREIRFQAEDGYVVADELLSEKSYALAANGYLKFLEHHPDHPNARDVLQKARDAFRSAGYAEKAFWVHQEMMKRFPENKGEDLMSLAQMEKDARRLDEAIQHAGEAAEAARIEEDRVWRLLYRAWFVQLRDGDAVGLQALREVEQLAESLGLGAKNPGKKVKEKIAELEDRFARGR